MKALRMPIIAGVLMIFVLAVVGSGSGISGWDQEGLLHVNFLDVGQGDSIFIESPSGTQVLIDGGKGSVVLGRLQSVMGFFDRDIDMLVATHPDMDHIGGLIDVLMRYSVKTILMSENISDTPTFTTFSELVEKEGAQIIFARRGQVFDLGKGSAGSTTLTILFPDHNPQNLESNTASIVGRLVYGESEYMLTGDSPLEIEKYLVGLDPLVLDSDVLKAGHHGSRTSSSEMFVEVVSPTYAVISAGKGNSYGHPHPEVVDTFTNLGVQILSTIDRGTIETVSDGKNIVIK